MSRFDIKIGAELGLDFVSLKLKFKGTFCQLLYFKIVSNFPKLTKAFKKCE